MEFVLTTLVSGKFVKRVLGKANVRSVRAMREGLERHAVRIFGGREGRDWRVKMMPGALVPIYVADRLGDTITVE